MKRLLYIGKLKIKYPYFTSPLAGLTDLPFRKLIDSIGYVGALFTEMISTEGLIRQNTQTLKMLESFTSPTPKFVQLFGNNPESFAKSVKYINDNTSFDGIDLNAGCPVKKIVNKGAGSFLLEDTENLKKIVKSIRKNTEKTFTVKIRLGFKKVNISETIKIIDGEGADGIIVHFRTKKDGYSVPAKWEFSKKIKELTNLPVIGNGDIFNIKTAKERLKKVDGIMLGRGIVINPSFFKELETGEREKDYIILERFIRLIENFYPEEKLLPRLKAFLRYFSKGKGISKKRKKELFLSKDYEFVRNESLQIFSELD